MKARRRRGLLLLALALASGGLAASAVRERERSVEEKVGPLVPVVVAARGLEPDEPLRRADLAVERVPARFVPADAVGTPGRLAGARTAVAVAAGSYLTAGLLQGATAVAGGPLRPGERALEIGVTGGGALAGAGPGSRVDVVVSTQRQEGSGRTFVALEAVELLELRAAGGERLAGGDPGGVPADTALATLRVTLRQAVYLAAAENFGHEVRLLVRPAGDRRRDGGFAVSEAEL
jgi:pilus assembly protein CpaB